jgi:hypothetical protein
MSKEIELRAADDLAAQINEKHTAIMVKVGVLKQGIAELQPEVAEIGMLLESAKDTVGDSYHHWFREKIEMPKVIAERYIKHYKNPDQMWFHGFKAIEDRQSVQEQAEANAQTAEGDVPRKDEHEDIVLRGIVGSWVYDANRWFKQIKETVPPERATVEQAMRVLEVVQKVRADIYAYEQRLLALTREAA